MGNIIAEERKEFNPDDFIKEDIPIPKKTYLLNENAFEQKIKNIDSCEAEDETKKKLKDIMNYIRDNTIHIDFKTFMQHLYKSVQKFEKAIGEKEYILYIPHPRGSPYNKKSNYWVSQIVYHMLKKKPSEIVSLLENIKNTEICNILVCDDGIFSGTQMHDISVEIKSFNEKFKISIVVPFSTDYGKNLVLNLYKEETVLYNESIIPEPKIPYLTKQKRSLFYFDHRIPDFMSTYQQLYNTGIEYLIPDSNNCMSIGSTMSLIKYCSIDSKDDCVECKPDGHGKTCPLIPYKNRENNEFVDMLTPSDILTKFPNEDLKKDDKMDKKIWEEKIDNIFISDGGIEDSMGKNVVFKGHFIKKFLNINKLILCKKITNIKRWDTGTVEYSPFKKDILKYALSEATINEYLLEIKEKYPILKKHLVDYYGCCLDKDEDKDAVNIYLFYEYFDGKPIINPNKENFSDNLLDELVKVICVLHENGVYHGDLQYYPKNSQNILYSNKSKNFKIIDFGESCFNKKGSEELIGRFCFKDSSNHTEKCAELEYAERIKCLINKDINHLKNIFPDRTLLIDKQITKLEAEKMDGKKRSSKRNIKSKRKRSKRKSKQKRKKSKRKRSK